MDIFINFVIVIFVILWVSWLLISVAFIVGFEEPAYKICNTLFYFSMENIIERKRIANLEIANFIREHGTEREKIDYHNEQNPDYQMLQFDELKEKYKGLDFSKVLILKAPCCSYNIHEEKLVDGHAGSMEVIDDKLQYKPGNVMFSVDNYSEINVEEMNKSEKIFIFPHKDRNFRYKLREQL